MNRFLKLVKVRRHICVGSGAVVVFDGGFVGACELVDEVECVLQMILLKIAKPLERVVWRSKRLVSLCVA